VNMKSKIDYYTRQFLDVYKQELYNLGFDKGSAAEKMLIAALISAISRFCEEVKK
jgi:hypothetical protein